jgi:hypothetical protein
VSHLLILCHQKNLYFVEYTFGFYTCSYLPIQLKLQNSQSNSLHSLFYHNLYLLFILPFLFFPKFILCVSLTFNGKQQIPLPAYFSFLKISFQFLIFFFGLQENEVDKEGEYGFVPKKKGKRGLWF